MLSLVGSLQSQSITIDSGATFQDQNGGMHDNTFLALNGSLVLNANDTIAELTGEGTVNLYGGSLTLNSGTFSGFITGTDADYGLIKNNDGEFVFSGDGSYVGPTQVNAGTFTLSGGLSSEVLNVASGATFHDGDSGLLPTLVATIDGTLELTNGEAIDTLNGLGVVSLVDSILTLNQGSFSGVISGSGGMTKNSSDSLTLSGTNTYTGSTEVNAGTLVLMGSLQSGTINIAAGASLVDSDGGLGSTCALTNAGTLVLANNDAIGSLVNSGTVMGDGCLTASTYALNDDSIIYANLGTGTITTNGTVQLYGTSAASVVNIAAESELSLMGEQLLLDSVTVNVTGVLSLNGGNQVIEELNGTGDVNVNTYALTVNNGGDFTGQLNATGTPLTAQGGTLNLTNNTVSTDSITVNTGASVNLSGSTATTNDIIVANTGTLSVAGSSNLTVDGNVQVQGTGSVTINPNSSLSAQVVTTDADSTIYVSDSSVFSYTTLNGDGTINTDGNVFTNDEYVHGYLNFTNDFTNNGTFHPGNSPGLITVGGNYTESGTLAVDLETTTPITGHGQVKVGGSVTLSPGSILNVRTYNGVFPTRGNVYQIIADSSGDPLRVNGTFTTVEFDRDGELGIASPVVNAAVIFDVATGQVTATGLNDEGSVYADLGSNENQRRAATAIFKGAEVGSYQIDTETFMGTRADEILVSAADTATNLAYYTPDYYGGMTDFAFGGDRSLVRQVLNRVSPMNDPSNDSFAYHGAFAGFMQNNSENADNVDLTRRDYFVGGDLTNGSDFSAGLVASKVSGGMRANLGKSSVDGAAGLIYARKALGNFTTIATVGYSAQDHKIHRPTMNGKVEATTTVSNWTGSVSLQYKGLKLGEFSITPRGSLVYSQAHVNEFKESGAVDALYNKGYGSNALTGEVGASALYSTKLWNRVFNVEILAGVEQTISHGKDNMDLHLVNYESVHYDMDFAKTNLIRATYGLNIGYNLLDSTQLNIGYGASSGSGCDQNFNVSVHVSI
jgi:autotransporter-associated beta strand protein